MNIINYENYNAQLIQGFDKLPVLVGKHACTPDFKVILSEPEGFQELVATTSEVRTKRNVLAIVENGAVRVEKRGHNKPTRIICYLIKPNDSDLQCIDVKSINPSPAGRWIMGQNHITKP